MGNALLVFRPTPPWLRRLAIIVSVACAAVVVDCTAVPPEGIFGCRQHTDCPDEQLCDLENYVCRNAASFEVRGADQPNARTGAGSDAPVAGEQMVGQMAGASGANGASALGAPGAAGGGDSQPPMTGSGVPLGSMSMGAAGFGTAGVGTAVLGSAGVMAQAGAGAAGTNSAGTNSAGKSGAGGTTQGGAAGRAGAGAVGSVGSAGVAGTSVQTTAGTVAPGPVAGSVNPETGCPVLSCNSVFDCSSVDPAAGRFCLSTECVNNRCQ